MTHSDTDRTPPESIEVRSLALIPHYGPGVHAHYESVRKSGLTVYQSGSPNIDHTRAVLLEYGLRREEVDVFVFIDSDVSFTREGYDRLVASCAETEGIVGVPYVQKQLTGKQILVGNVEFPPETDTVTLKFYEQGGLYPAKTLGMGFTAIHRKAVAQIARASELQKCWFATPDAEAILAYPLFLPMIVSSQYVNEDFAFCLRARAAGVGIFLETRPEIVHHGQHGFRIETIGVRSEKDPGLTVTLTTRQPVPARSLPPEAAR